LTKKDAHALELVRRAVAHLGGAPRPAIARHEARPPLHDPGELNGVIPVSARTPFDVREILARVVDGSELDEFKARYGITLVCGFAHIEGMPVGIVANNGVLYSDSALKGTHFIELCCQRGIPLVFLQNVTGCMVGRKAEHGGIARDGAKMVAAVACARVPKLTVIVGGSYGAGNYGMCGRAYSPRFLWMWPNARIAVMGGEQAANVLSQARRDEPGAGGDARRAAIIEQYARQSSASYASARLWDDGVIDPRATRETLARGLWLSLNAPPQETRFGVFRM